MSDHSGVGGFTRTMEKQVVIAETMEKFSGCYISYTEMKEALAVINAAKKVAAFGATVPDEHSKLLRKAIRNWDGRGDDE